MRARLFGSLLVMSVLSACAMPGFDGGDTAGGEFQRVSGNAFTSYGNLRQLRGTAASSSEDFDGRLALEYLLFAEEESGVYRDFVDADFFARKGLAVARSGALPPERPQSWPRTAAALDALSTGRAELLELLDGNARIAAPVEAARAQRLYDCWVEQQSEGFQPDAIASCRQRFEDAMTSLRAAMAPDEPIADDEPRQDAPLDYLVYFDFDEAELTDQGRLSVRLAAEDFNRGSGSLITVVGHTDRAGPEVYNVGLSERRARTVQQALIAQGVPAEAITVTWRGESQPAVATGDGVPNQENRRAEILLDRGLRGQDGMQTSGLTPR